MPTALVASLAGGRARRRRSSCAPSDRSADDALRRRATHVPPVAARAARSSRAAVRVPRRADRRRLLAARAALRAASTCSCRSSIGAALRVKVRLDGDEAHVATVSGVWPAANWLEREVWDLFGIEFDGHPDPRRLLMPEDWEGYPLRKDYPVQIEMKPRTTEPTAGDRGGVPREHRRRIGCARRVSALRLRRSARRSRCTSAFSRRPTRSRSSPRRRRSSRRSAAAASCWCSATAAARPTRSTSPPSSSDGFSASARRWPRSR